MVPVSIELGDFFDAAEFGLPIEGLETVALESVSLHAVVIISANSVQVGALGKLLELLWGLVEAKDFFDTVVVLTHVVFVLENAKRSVDLVLESVVHFFLT